VEAIAAAERRVAPGEQALATEVAHALFKLMAIKDEYEVARLFADGSFKRQLNQEFSAWEKLEFHLAPPILGRRDKRGHLRKQSFGPWMMRVFHLLAGMRFLRGSLLDPFAYIAERRWERRLLKDYEAALDLIAERLSPANLSIAVALAGYPRKIRGYGHVKEAQARPALAERERLIKAFTEPEQVLLAEAAE
jgi:indolepyruvate ferredoxin oxidoreductase